MPRPRLAAIAMRAIYRAAGAAAAAATTLRALKASDEDERRLCERRGFWNGHQTSAALPWVWIHAASVGEAEIAVALARRLGAKLPGVRMVISTMTASGQARVAREDGLESRFFPIDYARYLKRILDPLPPLLFVAVETEIWPETLRLLALRKVPAAVANARLSEASLPRYRRFRALLEPLVAGLATVCARDDEAAEKWRSLGASESALEVTGNIKFDLANPAGELMVVPLFERSSRTAGRTVAHDGPLLLAASTHEGEEALALDAFALVRARRDDARIIVAPRHPERTDAAIAAARERGLRTAKWGHLRAAKLPALWPSDLDVVVIDRLGLLRSAYEAADAAFVGGSAVEGPGGHNLLEPVTAGCAVATGPHLGNVADQSALLLEAKALRIVKDVAELSKFWLEVLDKPQIFSSATRTAVGRIRTRKGALDRTVAMLLSLVEKSARRA